MTTAARIHRRRPQDAAVQFRHLLVALMLIPVAGTGQDDGMGTALPAKARLFEKFYRAANAIVLAAEGTGQASGRIWCDSQEGRAATFTFTLPAAAAAKENA